MEAQWEEAMAVVPEAVADTEAPQAVEADTVAHLVDLAHTEDHQEVLHMEVVKCNLQADTVVLQAVQAMANLAVQVDTVAHPEDLARTADHPVVHR